MLPCCGFTRNKKPRTTLITKGTQTEIVLTPRELSVKEKQATQELTDLMMFDTHKNHRLYI